MTLCGHRFPVYTPWRYSLRIRAGPREAFDVPQMTKERYRQPGEARFAFGTRADFGYRKKRNVLRNINDSNKKRKTFFSCVVKMWNLKYELLKMVIDGRFYMWWHLCSQRNSWEECVIR